MLSDRQPRVRINKSFAPLGLSWKCKDDDDDHFTSVRSHDPAVVYQCVHPSLLSLHAVVMAFVAQAAKLAAKAAAGAEGGKRTEGGDEASGGEGGSSSSSSDSSSDDEKGEGGAQGGEAHIVVGM
jgi:hypothetical protein